MQLCLFQCWKTTPRSTVRDLFPLRLIKSCLTTTITTTTTTTTTTTKRLITITPGFATCSCSLYWTAPWNLLLWHQALPENNHMRARQWTEPWLVSVANFTFGLVCGSRRCRVSSLVWIIMNLVCEDLLFTLLIFFTLGCTRIRQIKVQWISIKILTCRPAATLSLLCPPGPKDWDRFVPRINSCERWFYHFYRTQVQSESTHISH